MGFGGGNIMVPVPDAIDIGDNPSPKISVMPLLRWVASWSLHMRGAHRFSAKQHKWWGVGCDRDRQQPRTPKISVMPLLRWVASWSLHMRGAPPGFSEDRKSV